MKNLGSFASPSNGQTYQVVAEIDHFGPMQVIAWRRGAEPIEFMFDGAGFKDPLLEEINTYVLNLVYKDPHKMPVPEDFEDALILP